MTKLNLSLIFGRASDNPEKAKKYFMQIKALHEEVKSALEHSQRDVIFNNMNTDEDDDFEADFLKITGDLYRVNMALLEIINKVEK